MAHGTVTRMQDERASDLRERTIAAALDLVAATGEEGLTMRDLARQVGISTTAMYQVFDGKPSIVRAVRLRAVSVLGDFLAPSWNHDDPRERIGEMSRRYIAWGRDRPALYRLLFVSEALEPALGNLSEEAHVLDPLHHTRKALQDGMERGLFRTDLDIHAVPFHIWAKNHGLVLMILAGKLAPDHPVLPVDDVDAYVGRFVDHTLVALAAAEAAC